MFDEVITTRERLREIIGEPSHRTTGKVIDQIDDICARFIAASPYAVVGTTGGDGLLDLSPKGDPAGFVRIIDEKTLAMPDRLGNRRADSFENLLLNPAVTVIFLIPGYNFTLRVAGRGSIVRDQTLQSNLAINGRAPDLILVVEVREAIMHCGKSIARAKLWQPEHWPGISNVPSLAEAMVAHGKLAEAKEGMQSIIDKDFETRMY